MLPERSVYEGELTDELVMQLAPTFAELLGAPAWGAYRELLKSRRIAAREAALDGPTDTEAIAFWKGFINALEHMERWPAEILARMEAIEKQEESAGERVVRVGGYRGHGAGRAALDDEGDPSFT